MLLSRMGGRDDQARARDSSRDRIHNGNLQPYACIPLSNFELNACDHDRHTKPHLDRHRHPIHSAEQHFHAVHAPDLYVHSFTDTHLYVYSFSDSDLYPNGHRHAHANQYPHVHPHADLYRQSDEHTHPDSYANRNAHCYRISNKHRDTWSIIHTTIWRCIPHSVANCAISEGGKRNL